MLAMLDRARIESILEELLTRLPGDWLLVGGGLVAIWIEPRRVTEDLDLIGLENASDQRFQLMSLAEAVGLPIEAVNSAAEFFVRRIEGWRDELELVRSSEHARLFRPSPTLFLLLKIARLSAQDLEDCLALLAKCDTPIDHERVLRELSALGHGEDPEVRGRRLVLKTEMVRRRQP
jgi:hypothetical protein